MRKPTCLLLSFAVIAFLVFIAIVRNAAQSPPANVALETNLVFGTGGKRPLHLDLTRPKQGTGPFPALVLVHGGGWVGGDKESLRSFMNYFSQQGMVCVSIEYRLAPKDTFPAQIEDVKCAVRWLRANADKYHVDPKRIGALGGSAGAHLVALLGTTNGVKKWEGNGGHAEQSSSICAMICMSGAYDLPMGYRNSVNQQEAEGKSVRGMLEAFLGGPPSKPNAQYEAASPLRCASKNTVPALLTHGTADPLVPIEQSEVFAARLKELGVDVEFLRLEGAGHADFGKKPQEALAHVAAFVHKHLLDTKR